MSNEVDNNQDVLDSRDIIARLEELESELQDAYDSYTEAHEDSETETFEVWLETQIADNTDLSEEASEYKSLKALCDEAEGYADDWRYGSTLIRASYFKEYAQQLAEDIGAIDPKANWPLNHIDWEAASEELKQDYTEVDFAGVAYYVR